MTIQPTGRMHDSIQRITEDFIDETNVPGSGDRFLAETEALLEQALRSYGMEPNIMSSRLTPNAALIIFKGNDNITVDRIEKKKSLLYTTWGLDVIAARPGKGKIIVMVARDDRQIVATSSVWQKRKLPDTAPYYNTSFVIGEREDNGEVLYVNMAHSFAGQPTSGPHMLIAGESGGGKGVLAANLLLDICATNSPAMARIIMIDPKSGADYQFLEELPHLEGNIICDMDGSIDVYNDLVSEMERRYKKLLGPTYSRDLDAYNAKSGKEDVPRIYVVHDEIADWMADDDYRKTTGYLMGRLAAKGRAAGIHLILITQRPDKKSIPSAVKANIANKICLRVANKINSNLIIDGSGGEALLGQGHMLAIIGGVPGGPVFAQSPFMDSWDAELGAKAITDETESERPAEPIIKSASNEYDRIEASNDDEEEDEDDDGAKGALSANG